MRAVNMAEQRVLEAKRLGFDTCVIPKVCADTIGNIDGIKIIGVSNVREAMNIIA